MGLHVALGFTKHGCWVLRVSFPTDNVIGEEGFQETITEAARLFLTWLRGQWGSSIDSATSYWLQVIRPPPCKGRGTGLQTLTGLWQDSIAEEHVGGKSGCGHL